MVGAVVATAFYLCFIPQTPQGPVGSELQDFYRSYALWRVSRGMNFRMLSARRPCMISLSPSASLRVRIGGDSVLSVNETGAQKKKHEAK